MRFRLAAQVAENYLSVSAKFPDDLPASTARRRQFFGVGNHRYRIETTLAFGDGFEEGHPLGANRQAVAGVFHVAARENAPGLRAHRGANAKIGKGRVCMVARRPGGIEQSLVMRHSGHTGSFPRIASAICGITPRSSAINSPFTRSPVSSTS